MSSSTRDSGLPTECTYCGTMLQAEAVKFSPDARVPICEVCLAKLNAQPGTEQKQCDYCGTRFYHPVAEALKKGPDGKTACDACFTKLSRPVDCFYCGEDLDYDGGYVLARYRDQAACPGCMAALVEYNTNTIKAPANCTSVDCEYCGKTIWLQEGGQLRTSEAGYTVCEKCERMVRHEHMAAMQRRVAENADCNRARQGQDTESRICNAGRFVDRSMRNPAVYDVGTTILMASLNYDVRVTSVEREYEAICRQRPHAVEEAGPCYHCAHDNHGRTTCDGCEHNVNQGAVTQTYKCKACRHIFEHDEVPGRTYLWNCPKCKFLARSADRPAEKPIEGS